MEELEKELENQEVENLIVGKMVIINFHNSFFYFQNIYSFFFKKKR